MMKRNALFARLALCGTLLLCTGCPELFDPAPDAGSNNPDAENSDASGPNNDPGDMDVADDGPPIIAPEGYTTGRILYRGSEAKLFDEVDAESHALALDGYGIMSFSLSGDGQVVWLALYNEFAPGGPDYKVFSMNVDGSNVEEASFVRPADAPYFPTGFRVRTTDDGELAVLTQYTYDSNDNVVAEISRASRGGSFSVLTTSNGEVEGLGLAESVSTEVTADGSAVLFTTGRIIWRANESDGWVPFEIYRIDDLSWNGEDVPGNAVMRGLDITDNGGEFATRANISTSETAIIVGTGIGATAFEATADRDFYPTAEIDGAGEVVTYSHSNPRGSWLGPKGGTHDEITAPAGSITNIDLADGGQVFHATAIPTKPIPFFGFVGSDERVASLSQQWSIFGMISSLSGQLDNAGNVFVTSNSGLIAVHRDRVAYGAHVDAVFWRFDEEGNLVIRAQVRGEQEVVYVSAMPLFERYIRPSFLYGSGEDPTYLYRNGIELVAVEDEPNTYEATFPIDTDATEPLDERFSFRVLVGQGTAGEVTSTGFVDFDLFE